MAVKSLPIIFVVFLVLSPVFARELGEKPEEKAANDQTVGDDKRFMTGTYGHRPGPFGHGCRFLCGRRCCSAAEYAEFSQSLMDANGNGFEDEKQYGPGYGPRPGYGYGPRPGYGYGPRPGYGCRYRCGYRCCAAEEYAEYMLVQSGPQI